MRYDIEALKTEIDCRTFAAGFTTLEEKNQKEKFGPCPVCQGNDRFNVQKEKWLCRTCTGGKWRDVIHLAALVWQLDTKADFKTICERLGAAESGQLFNSSKQLNNWRSTDDAPPSIEWQADVKEIVRICHKLLFSEQGEGARRWLNEKRGLTDETLLQFFIGYNPADQTINGHYVHRGILIPHFQQSTGILWGVKIRRPSNEPGKKYKGISGGKQNLFNCDSLTGQQYAFVTEGEFDAMLLAQELGSMAAVVTLGGVSSQLGDRWLPALLPIKRFFLSLDTDKPGQQGLSYWQGLTGKRGHAATAPTGKDITEFWQGGNDLRAWGLSLLPPPPAGAEIVLYFDGASKEGLSTYGWRIAAADDTTLQEGSGQAEGATGNTGEYSGLIAGLKAVSQLPALGCLTIKGDSQLVINQIKGEWRIKSDDLKPLHHEAQELIEALAGRGVSVIAVWVDRKENKQADKLSKAARESATPEPDLLYLKCQQAIYPITINFADGTTTYTTPEEAYNDLWARSMLKEAAALGGVK